jgi:hypothetical protein
MQPETYAQIIDFTPLGGERFAQFIEKYGRSGLDPDSFRLECLGMLEERVNDGGPVSWTLLAEFAANGESADFVATEDDLIIEVIVLAQAHEL